VTDDAPSLPSASPLQAFAERLTAEGFEGEVAADTATRIVHATDNSVYEMAPLAVVFPRVPDDLNRIARAATACRIAITARGGGTGTNGQSLTDRVTVDCSRHLTRIEEVNPAEGYAVVQPGVILDQLNRAVRAHGLFFAPTVSTASRATLGGMAATDASGKGSRVYGRTSDHVLGMEAVLADGTDLMATGRGEGVDPRGLSALLRDILDAEAPEIERVFPVMNRGLTGYNLKEARQGGGVSLVKLLCGSEGTLALTKRLTLRLLPLPKRRALVIHAYDDMDAALRDVGRLVTAGPTAIEFIDDRILSLARQDPVWTTIAGVLAQDADRPVRGLNFVEVTAEDDAGIDAVLAGLAALGPGPASLIDARPVTDPATVAELWQLRSKCVGLLGRMDPTRQGTPFVEDAAVPAENIAGFVAEFREILDARGLSYGMFGHADVGCVHVRPALDMRRPEDAAMIRTVSDAVHRLARRHGGLIWGEHGKGFRGEYGPEVFGPRLYAAMCRIKAAFDPDDLLNPGKIATPDPARPLTRLDAVPFRGPLDAAIAPALAATYDAAIRCNGNGQCMGRDVEDAMCPSFKATGDRRRGPKGRAAMLRTWARLKSAERVDEPGLSALEAQLLDSLSDCLGCKACASQCPVKVDIPAMRSAFYEQYYARRRRPVAHRLLGALEPMAPVLRRLPRLANLGMRLGAPILRRAGLVDLPRIRPSGPVAARGGSRGRVLLIADSFLATFDGAVIEAGAALLGHLGYDVTVSAPLATGKPLYVIGARRRFARVAERGLARLRRAEADGMALVVIEPAFVSMFAGEYPATGAELPAVTSIDRFLSGALEERTGTAPGREFTLFLHCSESASDPQTAARWVSIFAACGLTLTLARTGCCGMAGTFGHEADKVAMSERLYDLSWRGKVDAAAGRAVATGFSCRCQAGRFSGRRIPHPVETLRSALIPD